MAKRPEKRKIGTFTKLVWIFGLVSLFFAVNWVYQVVRKPSELVGLFDTKFFKTPYETWREYKDDFEGHSTAIMTPDFLAALAQVESQGNSLARTYWRWKFSTNPFEIYTPASSAVGMYQITDGTSEETKRYCVHNNRVVEDGPWYKLNSCWFNTIYSRLLPSHSIEMTSATLHRKVEDILRRAGKANAEIGLEEKQNLATVVHLCGPGRGDRFARNNFRPLAGEKCGSHKLSGYLARVNHLKKRFKSLKDTGAQYTDSSGEDVD